MKMNYFPLLFSLQPGAKAVITGEAKRRSGYRNLKWQLSQRKAQETKVCKPGCKAEHQDTIEVSLPLHSVASLVMGGEVCCFC